MQSFFPPEQGVLTVHPSHKSSYLALCQQIRYTLSSISNLYVSSIANIYFTNSSLSKNSLTLSLFLFLFIITYTSWWISKRCVRRIGELHHGIIGNMWMMMIGNLIFDYNHFSRSKNSNRVPTVHPPPEVPTYLVLWQQMGLAPTFERLKSFATSSLANVYSLSLSLSLSSRHLCGTSQKACKETTRDLFGLRSSDLSVIHLSRESA